MLLLLLPVTLAGLTVVIVGLWTDRRIRRRRAYVHPVRLVVVTGAWYALVNVSGLLLAPVAYRVLYPGAPWSWLATWSLAQLSFALLPIVVMASLIIAAVQGGRLRREGCCECGYDLTGNVSGVCPECGTPAKKP